MDTSYPLPPGLAALAQDLPMDELAFEPAPVKARHDGWTADRQRGFITRLALSGSVAASAKAVGMTGRSAYRLRSRADAGDFAAAWDRAARWGLQTRFDRALEQAIIGEVRPIFYRGRRCGEKHLFNHSLALAVLNLAARRGSLPPGSPDAHRVLHDFLRRIR